MNIFTHSARGPLLRTLPFAIGAGLVLSSFAAHAQEAASLSRQTADAVLRRWPASQSFGASRPPAHSAGLLLEGMDAAWYNTADHRYYDYVRSSVDAALPANVSAPSLPAEIALGRQYLFLYRVTQNKRYYQAARQLREQISQSPQIPTDSSHQSVSPTAAEPFLAEYASVFRQQQDFPRIAQRLILAAHLDPGPASRSSALASFMSTLVDALPYFPPRDPGRAELVAILRRDALVVGRVQDSRTGLPGGERTASASAGKDADPDTTCLLVYALARGVRLGYLPKSQGAWADRAWQALHTRGIGGAGSTLLAGHAPSADEAEPSAAFLLAATEMDLRPTATEGLGQAVLLDAWYNSQQRQNAAGQTEYFHYKWDDYSNSGFSLFGHIFRSFGIATDTLYTSPTAASLESAHFYLIVSPDNPAKNPSPHFMTAADAQQIAAWVHGGGVLLLMENDPANADITHLDTLANIFGLHFNDALTHHVIGGDFSMGRIDVRTPAPPFIRPHVLYMKDTSSLALSKGASPLFRWKGDTLMASAKYGKGTVYAVADPWLYNEYTDGRKLPPEYDNFAAGRDLVAWLLHQK